MPITFLDGEDCLPFTFLLLDGEDSLPITFSESFTSGTESLLALIYESLSLLIESLLSLWVESLFSLWAESLLFLPLGFFLFLTLFTLSLLFVAVGKMPNKDVACCPSIAVLITSYAPC